MSSYMFALQFVSRLAYMVIIPLFLFGGLGLAADRHFHTLPLFLLIGVGVAFGLTMYWIFRRFGVKK